jgi:hypothetical protein
VLNDRVDRNMKDRADLTDERNMIRKRESCLMIRKNMFLFTLVQRQQREQSDDLTFESSDERERHFGWRPVCPPPSGHTLHTRSAFFLPSRTSLICFISPPSSSVGEDQCRPETHSSTVVNNMLSIRSMYYISLPYSICYLSSFP